MSNKLTKAEKTLRAAVDVLAENMNLQATFNQQRAVNGITFPHQMRGDYYQQWLRSFSEEEAESANAQLQSIRQGLFTLLPLICPSNDSCPHWHVCPFKPKTPRGQQCPLEQSLIIDTMENLMVEFQIDGRDYSNFMLANRLVELELMDKRTTSMLSGPKYQSIIRLQITGATNQGDVLENEIVNPLLDLKEKISREKMKLLNTLVATPEAKYKKQAALKESSEDDYSTKISDMNKKLVQIEEMLLLPEGEK